MAVILTSKYFAVKFLDYFLLLRYYSHQMDVIL